MNELQKELQELKEKVAELELRIPTETEEKKWWNPKSGRYYVSDDGNVYKDYDGNTTNFGNCRDTIEQAWDAAFEMRKFNRLMALRDELCDYKKVDLHNPSTNKYFVAFDLYLNKWDVTCVSNFVFPTSYFTTRELAQKACDMLNSGEVEL